MNNHSLPNLFTLFSSINMGMSKILVLDSDNEAALIEACCRKDPQAERQLYSLYHKKMFAVCIRYLKEEEDAFEALNQAFLKVFEKIRQFKAETKLEFWIRRIVVNTIIDYIRKNKSYKKHFIKTDEFAFYGKPDEANDDISEWWEKATSIPSEVLLQQVSQLPPATRVVFNLYAIEGYNHREIAEKINISEGTSKWHLSNARKILKEKVIEIITKEKNYENRQFKEY